MNIQPLSVKDVDIVSQISLRAFMQSVADTVKPEGVETFTSLAKPEAYRSRMENGNVILSAKEGDQVLGVIELKEGKHLAMLFVDPEYQGRGIGRSLLQALIAHIKGDTMTVKASLPSVPFYQSNGFKLDGEIGEIAGLIYQPLVLIVD